jgi:hypothetical protein
MTDKDEFWLEENYVTNYSEIIELAEQHYDKFSGRGKGHFYEFGNDKYGSSEMYTLFQENMSSEIKQAIFKTIRPEELTIPPDRVIINRYDPGSFLVRHKDIVGKHWKFQLIFLRTDKPHLKVYSKNYPEGKLIEEKPGALFHMPLTLEHEVTVIEQDEKPKLSLVLAWCL